MTPEIHILPSREGTNPVRMIDFGGGSLSDVLSYCSRVLGWSSVVMIMARSPAGRGKSAEIGDLSEEDLRSGSVETNIVGPDGATVRRVVVGPAVLALISGPEGEVLDVALETIQQREDSPVKLAEEYWEDIGQPESGDGDGFEDEFDEFDDEEEELDEEEDEDEEDEDEDEDEDEESE